MTFRIALIAAVFPCLVGLACANPFAKPYVLGIKGLNIDGDLWHPITLGRVALDGSTPIEIWCETRLEDDDFGAGHSVVVFHPLETGVFARPGSRYAWIRPGGGEIYFTAGDDVPGPNADEAHLPSPGKKGLPLLRTMRTSGVELNLYVDGTQVIVDEGWLLTYKRGELFRIRTPKGLLVDVNSNGRFVLSFTVNGKVVLSADRAGAGTPHLLRTPEGDLRIDRLERSMVVTGNDNKVLAELLFDRRGLVESIRSFGREADKVEWEPVAGFANPRTEFPLRYFCRRFSRFEYRYLVKNDRRRIEVVRDGVREALLQVQYRLGRVVSLETETQDNAGKAMGGREK